MPATPQQDPEESEQATDDNDIALGQYNAVHFHAQAPGFPNDGQRQRRRPVAQNSRDNDPVDLSDPVVVSLIFLDNPPQSRQVLVGEQHEPTGENTCSQADPSDEEELQGAVGGVPAEYAHSRRVSTRARARDPREYMYFPLLDHAPGYRSDEGPRNAELARNWIDHNATLLHNHAVAGRTSNTTVSSPYLTHNVSPSTRSADLIPLANCGHVTRQACGNSSSTRSNHPALSAAEVPSTSRGILQSHSQNEMPAHPEYTNGVTRGLSFQRWSGQHEVSTDYLSRVGLFYTGYGNCCVCFYCGSSFQNWWHQDDPVHEHIRLYPNCRYIQDICRADYISSYQNGDQLRATDSSYESTLARLQGLAHPELSTHPVVIFLTVCEGYDMDKVIRAAAQMRKAGQSLSAPAILARLYQHSPEVRRNPLHTVQSCSCSQHSVTQECNNQLTVNHVTTTSAYSLQELKAENQRIVKRHMCVCCEIRVIEYLFRPCGHLACHICNAKFQSCILCGSLIRERIKVSFDILNKTHDQM